MDTTIQDEELVSREAPPASGLLRAVRLGDPGLLDELQAAASLAHQALRSNTPHGPMTGLRKLDAELGGSLPSGLHIPHGSPGSGKTAFCLQIATSCGFPALYVSCEMSALELLRRHTARMTSTHLGDLKSGALPPNRVVELARQAAERAPQLVIADASRAFAPLEWIERLALATRGKSDGILIVVDSLHSWADGADVNVNEYERLNAALAALRRLAQTLSCPVVAIAERNRSSMDSGGMSATAGTRKFEYLAESVLDLRRESNTHPDPLGEVPVQVVLAKNRNGAPGKSIRLRFHGAFQRFREE